MQVRLGNMEPVVNVFETPLTHKSVVLIGVVHVVRGVIGKIT